MKGGSLGRKWWVALVAAHLILLQGLFVDTSAQQPEPVAKERAGRVSRTPRTQEIAWPPRIRVETPDGIMVVYDISDGEDGRPTVGAYWNDAWTSSLFVYSISIETWSPLEQAIFTLTTPAMKH